MAARIDRNRRLPIPYVPGPPPSGMQDGEQVLRAIWEELSRISQSLIDADRPISATVRGADTLAVGATEVYERLLNNSPLFDWLKPGGTFDPTTGIYTVPSEGLYLLIMRVVLDPFKPNFTRSYKCSLRATVIPADGGPNIVRTLANGAPDDSYLTVIGQSQIPLSQGDQLYFDAAATHTNQTGTVAVNSVLTILRVSGTGDA